mgnify:CR=1 FL=1|jgi:putative membrane protein (TIGR04086 family)
MPRKNAAVPVKTTSPAFPVILKGVIFAYLISLFCFLAFSVLIQYTSLSESVMPYTVNAVSLISVFAGAAYSTRKLRVKGWLNGGLLGLVYLAGLIILGKILLPGFHLDITYLTKIILAFSAGAAGGIFGINL